MASSRSWLRRCTPRPAQLLQRAHTRAARPAPRTHSSSSRYCCACGLRSSHLVACVSGRFSLVTSAASCACPGAAAAAGCAPNRLGVELAGTSAPVLKPKAGVETAAGVDCAPKSDGVLAAPNRLPEDGAAPKAGVPAVGWAPKSAGVLAGAPNAGVLTAPVAGAELKEKLGAEATVVLAAPKREGVEAGVAAAPNGEGVEAGVAAPNREGVEAGVPKENAIVDEAAAARVGAGFPTQALLVRDQLCKNAENG